MTRKPFCILRERHVGLQDIKFNVHAHPTLSEVLDELFKAAHVETKAPGKVCTPPRLILIAHFVAH